MKSACFYSPSHSWINWTILLTTKFKTQNFSLSTLIQKWININFRIQRSCGKPFLMILGRFRTKVQFWKKSSSKFAKIAKKCHIFKIWKFDLRPKLVGNWPICGRKVRLVQSLAKMFFMWNGQKLTILSQKNIPPKKGPFFWGGGINYTST